MNPAEPSRPEDAAAHSADPTASTADTTAPTADATASTANTTASTAGTTAPTAGTTPSTAGTTAPTADTTVRPEPVEGLVAHHQGFDELSPNGGAASTAGTTVRPEPVEGLVAHHQGFDEPSPNGGAAPTAAPSPPAAVVTLDPWIDWRRLTPARLALGRAGAGMPTDETLRFGWAHAMARDSIHAALDVDALESQLREHGWSDVLQVTSRAADRTTYLRRPDLGRQLDAGDAERLRQRVASGATGDVCIVVGDGLSSLAVERQALPLLTALRSHLPADTRYTPVVLATQARVALGDEVGEIFGARLLVVLIGERPGLSSPDSLGIYLTHDPKRGRHDAERNCISNVRPDGLGHDAAAFKLAWLMRESLRRGLSGVGLKDESDLAILADATGPVVTPAAPARGRGSE